MWYLYLFMILLAAFPLVLTIWRIRKLLHIRKAGIHVNGSITHIRTIRIKYTQVDLLTIEYRDRATGRVYPAKATAQRGKYRYSDPIPIAYLPGNPAKYALTNTGGSYNFMLVFCLLLFLFVLFAVYKIDGMVKAGEL